MTLGIRTKETTHPKFFLFDTGRDRLLIDGIDVMPAGLFLEELHAGSIVG